MHPDPHVSASNTSPSEPYFGPEIINFYERLFSKIRLPGNKLKDGERVWKVSYGGLLAITPGRKRENKALKSRKLVLLGYREEVSSLRRTMVFTPVEPISGCCCQRSKQHYMEKDSGMG